MNRLQYRCAALVVALVALAAPAVAGHVYTFEVRNVEKDRVSQAMMKVSEPKLAMEIPPQGRRSQGGTLIFDGKKVIVADDKGHFIINQKKIEQIAAMMQSASPQGMPEMSPEMLEAMRNQIEQIADPATRQRALEEFEARFGAAAGEDEDAKPKIELVEQGKGSQGGYACVWYQVLENGVRVSDICAAEYTDIPGGRELRRTFNGFADFYRQMMDTLAEASVPGVQLLGDDNPLDSFFALGKFPVATTRLRDGREVERTVLTNAAQEELGEENFKPAPESVERSFGM